MIKVPNLKDLPNKEDLEFKEKAFLIDFYEQFRQTSKRWFYALAIIAILSIPLGMVFTWQMANFFIKRLPQISISGELIHPKDLKTAQVNFFPVGRTGLFSVYAHVFNPNADLSARSFKYEFIFKNQSGAVLKTVIGSDFLLRGASRFVVAPAVQLSENPTVADFMIREVQWTRAELDFKLEFDILQKQWGDVDGKFFVEAVIKNPNSVGIKRMVVPVVIFGEDNKTVLAVNQTVLDDIESFQSRYFRVFWPVAMQDLFSSAIGQIEIGAEANPLAPGIR